MAIRILLVEDHEASRDALAFLLGLKGFDVEAAGCIARAVELVNLRPFDLVISDINLPDGSGHDLMAYLHDHFPELPGIAITANGMQKDITRSREAGFSEHLTKPFSFSELSTTIATYANVGTSSDLGWQVSQ